MSSPADVRLPSGDAVHLSGRRHSLRVRIVVRSNKYCWSFPTVWGYSLRDIHHLVVCFCIQYVEESRDDFIQQLAAAFECYDCVLECRKFRIVGNGSDFLVQLPDSFVESWFILFCFDLVEWRSSERSPISLEKGIFYFVSCSFVLIYYITKVRNNRQIKMH